MIFELQNKIANDYHLQRFLHENSSWYKLLNRNPDNLKEFIYMMKDKYELKPSDKLNKMMDNLNMIQSFLEVLK